MTTLPTPMRASVRSSAPWYSAGYPIEPTPTMTACPSIRRGTDCTVPIMPGLVIVAIVPAKSSGDSLFSLTLRISSSYALKNALKSIEPALRMFGTMSVRPSPLRTSTARPRCTCSLRMAYALPPFDAYVVRMPGIAPSARATA